MARPRLDINAAQQISDMDTRRTFVSRTVEVEAVQLSERFIVEQQWPEWFRTVFQPVPEELKIGMPNAVALIKIHDPNNPADPMEMAFNGNWIVRYEDGHVMVVRDDEFRYLFQPPTDAHTDRDFTYILNSYAAYVNRWARGKGFWDNERNGGELIALMHSELSEALEGLRDGNPPDKHLPDFSSLEVEFADVIIRILDTCAGWNLRIGEAIVAKMQFNNQRPHKHGRQF